ncbi:MAG: LysM peptidoglycan-binding domain-containing protein [Candidatus Omnitrophica bacterium]|nr:LysM peptidoglycan-binding domain-containing protein [Candidatus Omnitrophota bacterium]
MKESFWFLAIIFLALCGCETLVNQQDLQGLKQELAESQSRLEAKVEDLREEVTKKIEEQSSTLSTDRAALAERIENLARDFRELGGKLNDLEFQIKENLRNNLAEQESKNIEFRRDIETLKKSYTELISSLTSSTTAFQQAVTAIQNELTLVKNHQNAISNLAEKLREKLTTLENNQLLLEQKVQELRQEIAKKSEVLLSEMSRQESELRHIRTSYELSGKSLQELREEINKKINFLLEEIVRQESIIQLLQSKTGGPDVAKGEKKTKEAITQRLSSATAITYTVKPGETLTRIAKNHGTTVQQLVELNNLKSKEVKAGQKLKIPPRQ